MTEAAARAASEASNPVVPARPGPASTEAGGLAVGVDPGRKPAGLTGDAGAEVAGETGGEVAEEPVAGVVGDVVDAVLGAGAGAVRALRESRSAVVEHTQGVYDALLDGPATASIGRERLVATAVAVAELAGAPRLAAHYAGLGTVPAEGDPVLAAILRHAARVTAAPASITRADIDGLAAVGLSERDIVTVAQLIGFVHFQVRLLAGLELIGADHE